MEWDGVERRECVLADERTRGDGNTVEIPAAITLAGFAIVVLLLAGSLIGHAIMARDLDSARAESNQFRKEISCFVVGTAQGKSGPDLLSACGFIKLGVD